MAAPDAPFEETLEALDRLREAGKIHYVALSNFEAWQLGLGLALATERRFAEISVLQPRYWRCAEPLHDSSGDARARREGHRRRLGTSRQRR
jgi:aryl-alcohol dehydrogenase-like predicted oxidoreductase